MARDPGLDDGVVQSDREAIARALRSKQQIGWQSSSLAWRQTRPFPNPEWQVDQQLGKLDLERPEDSMPWVLTLKPWFRQENLASLPETATPQSGGAINDVIRARIRYGNGAMGPQEILVDWPGPGTSICLNGVSVAVDVVGVWTARTAAVAVGSMVLSAASTITIFRAAVPITVTASIPAGVYTQAALLALINGQLAPAGVVVAFPGTSSWTFDAGAFVGTFDAGGIPAGPLATLLGFTSDAPAQLVGNGPIVRNSPNPIVTGGTAPVGGIEDAPPNFGASLSPARDFARPHFQAPTLTVMFEVAAGAGQGLIPVPNKATAFELQELPNSQVAGSPVVRFLDNRTSTKMVGPANPTITGPWPPQQAPQRLPWWCRLVEVQVNATTTAQYAAVFYLTP